MDNLNKKITDYWTERSKTFSDSTIEALYGKDAKDWENLIYTQIDKNKKLKVLDVGTGPGMFAVLMGKNPNFEVFAVDSSSGMLEQAKKNAETFEAKINFTLVDAHTLPFEDESFDVIMMRNVTWNLPNPKEAYKEWKRVLKPNGKIINFDANWYLRLYNGELQKAYEENPDLKLQKVLPKGMEKRMEEIAKSLPLSKEERPAWDIQCLLEIGFTKINLDANVNELVYSEEQKKMYAHSPQFMITVTK